MVGGRILGGGMCPRPAFQDSQEKGGKVNSMATYHSLAVVEGVIDHYAKNGGNCEELREGVLGYGTLVLTAPGLKTAVIRERYLNEWSSAHTIRLYNKRPENIRP